LRRDAKASLNTGIGDAVNLSWKLAAVVHGRSHASLLDSYEPERIAFARRLVATTDRAFTGVTSDGAIARACGWTSCRC
jgi:2-polyprenyl-6-methoxyphenol hydroxylase-like FAD-dependent oxidoreductase